MAIKKVIRWVATILIVCIVTMALNLLIEGIPLLGTPKVENIDRIVVTYTDYLNDVKELTDEASGGTRESQVKHFQRLFRFSLNKSR